MPTSAKPKLQPFANDADSFEIAGLTIENGADSIAVYGNLDLTRDKPGLEKARTLKSILDAVVQALEADKALPDKIEPPKKPDEVKNPFG
ncbi:MAG TPA: hypothetical protein VGD08_15690 [Stellaceae bacterium]